MFQWLHELLLEEPEKPTVTAEELPDDPLLREALLLKKKAEAQEAWAKKWRKEESKSLLEEGVDEVVSGAKTVSRFGQTVHTLWEDYLYPVLSLFGPVGSALMWVYRKLYARFAFTVDEEGKRTVFSKKRSAGTIVGLFLGTILSGYLFVFHFIPGLVLFSFDAVAINLFDWEDELVFSKPDWVVGSPGELSVFACRRYPCVGQDDSVEFRIRDSIYLDFVRTVTRLEPHDPGELAGAFVSEENRCTIRAYGIRIKYLRLYPYIFEATCVPVKDTA